ncbi:MAG: DUF4468 domain-containing protein [Chryseobacterium sp.]|nr:MAG: DUF4468 domain-containing protein [Chryseobacterium sp.]
MKRFLLFLLLTAATTSIMAQVAQRFDLKHNGFVDAKDSTNNYVVLDYPKMSKVDLYKKTLTYLNGLYKNPAAVISTVDGESITVNGHSDQPNTDNGVFKYPFDYNIVFQFKDGKMRAEPRITKIEEMFNGSFTPFYISSTDSPKKTEVKCIYMKNKNGQGYWLFQGEIKESFNAWSNSYLWAIDKAITEKW